MKIKTVSCKQFAGIRDKSISFNEGINLIYGKNESGKSTIVNLLSRTLFQNARIDGRSDKDFKNLYFPGSRKDSDRTGDFADGEISFDTEEGTYTLTKEWGRDARCTLSTPNGEKIRDQKQINDIMKETLLYGEGVYSDMLFSAQRNTDASLQTILDASKKTDAKREITDAVSLAFSESDGVTADAIEQALDSKIKEIAGKHWDEERCAPARKPGGGRWAKETGEILKAYYDMEDEKEVLEEIKKREKAASDAITDYEEKVSAADKAENDYNNFHRFAGQLMLQNAHREKVKSLESEIDKLKKIQSEWPELTDSLEKACVLEKEKEARAILDKYESAKKLNDEIEELGREVGAQDCPGDSEISDVKAAQRKIAELENSLCSMNLSAAIRMFGGNTVSITSLRTGQTLDIADPMSITEAVKIVVPGVMEMQLAPADVDVSEIKAEIDGQKRIASDIFRRYDVKNLEELENLKERISRCKAEIEKREGRLSMVLGTEDYASVESAAKAIVVEVRSMESIEGDILKVCGNEKIGSYIAVKEGTAQCYSKEYGSIDQLEKKVSATESELEQAQESLKAIQNIPEEYANISDPQKHLEGLKKKLESRQDTRDKAYREKSNAEADLNSYRNTRNGDPAENAEKAKRTFDEKKELLEHWRHIGGVFADLKQQVQNNPMQDISDSFTRYLSIISGGRITSEFPDPEKLDMNIYSGSSLMDYDKLSEGTKETVSLAFRLAVLDHLFPNGGGVIILDDPFTDMDADRTAQSCELIKECATRHQVIFLTCKEEYADMLGVNEIRLEARE